MDVGNLSSGSSAFLKPAWTSGSSQFIYCWSLAWRILSFASVWDECNCVIVWAFFGIDFLWTGMKTDLFQSCGQCCVFQICWHIECSTFIAPSFRIWNSSTGINTKPTISHCFTSRLLSGHSFSLQSTPVVSFACLPFPMISLNPVIQTQLQHLPLERLSYSLKYWPGTSLYPSMLYLSVPSKSVIAY